MSIAPTAVWEISTSVSTSVVAKAWGRPQDWSTSRLKMEGDQPEAMEVIGLLGGLAQEHNLGRIFSPTVSEFNSEFLNDAMQSPWKLSLPGTACKLYRGLKVEGFEIYPGDAGVIAPADCAVIIVTTAMGRVFMLNAGRNSLIDRICIDTKGEIKSKRCESIIFAAWNNLRRVLKDDARNSKWFVLPSISAGEHFKHQFDVGTGESNERMVAYILKKYGRICIQGHPAKGMIDIPAIIAAQLVNFCGINPDQITVDTRCTYKEVNSGGNYVWHSCRRAAITGGDPKAQNLVVVVNKGR